MDIKFIQFYLLCKYNKSIESYFFVSKSTVSNWRKRGRMKNIKMKNESKSMHRW